MSTQIEILNSEWFWLLPFVMGGLIYIFIGEKYPRRIGLIFGKLADPVAVRHPLIRLFKQNIKSHKPRSLSELFYRATVFSLLILSLAQPVKLGEKLPDPPRQRDIVFIIDTSVSMVLRDYILEGQRIDRMNLLKGFLDRFVRELKGERISLIVFGDSAYTLVPLTRDQTLLRYMLARIDATMAGRFKAVGEGIALAVKQAEIADKGKKTKKRVLVLLTDGNQPTGKIEPLAAAALAKQAGIPLYTIAIGATSYSAEEKRRIGLLYHPADVDLLKKIAEQTGAKSYQAGNAQALEQAVYAISGSETYEQEITPRFYRQPLYQWPLFLALMIVIFAQLNTIIRKNRQ